jgi:hypothetical protein
MATTREFTSTFKTMKGVVRLDGDHRGSNDAFSYEPLQYRLSQEGDGRTSLRQTSHPGDHPPESHSHSHGLPDRGGILRIRTRSAAVAYHDEVIR